MHSYAYTSIRDHTSSSLGLERIRDHTHFKTHRSDRRSSHIYIYISQPASRSKRRVCVGCMTLKGGASQACAACKYQRRRCLQECQLAPYFPADQPKMFQNAHRLFGVSNILKILKLVNPNERSEAMRSIIYESEIREKDPVLGCFGFIQQLRYRVQLFENELQAIRFQLMQFTPNTSNNHHMMHIHDFEPAEQQLWGRQQFQFVDHDHQQQQFQVPDQMDNNMHNSFINDGQSSFIIDSKVTYECSSSDSDELLSLKDLTTEHRLVDSRHLKHSPAYFSLTGGVN